jgi:hypothetical protein
MSDTKFRRAIEFPAELRDALANIKGRINAKTDTAAVNYAIKLAARLSTCREADIEQALWLRDEISRHMTDGATLVIEKDAPASRCVLLVPPLITRMGHDDQPSRSKSEAEAGYEELQPAA